jgi:hypothetical protein
MCAYLISLCMQPNSCISSSLELYQNYIFTMYKVWQFNSQSGPVKAKFEYMCTSGCYHLRNTVLVKLRSSWGDGSTAGIPRSNVVTLCWISGMSTNLCPFRTLLNAGKSQKSKGAKSGEWGGWPVFAMDFIAKNSRARFRVFSSEQIPVTLSALPSNTLCPYCVHICVFGCSLLGSSCTFSRPSFNNVCYSKTLDFFIAYSP